MHNSVHGLWCSGTYLLDSGGGSEMGAWFEVIPPWTPASSTKKGRVEWEPPSATSLVTGYNNMWVWMIWVCSIHTHIYKKRWKEDSVSMANKLSQLEDLRTSSFALVHWTPCFRPAYKLLWYEGSWNKTENPEMAQRRRTDEDALRFQRKYHQAFISLIVWTNIHTWNTLGPQALRWSVGLRGFSRVE